MKKKTISMFSKRALAFTLSFILVTPVAISNINSVTAEAYEYSIDVPAPITELNFDAGFKGEATQKNSEGQITAVNDGLEVVESEPVLNYMCVETKVGETDTIYEFDFTKPLYTGTGADASYKKVAMANIPSSEYDEVMGNVLWMHKDYTVSEFIKTEPAAYTNETTGELLTEINNVLDKAVPPYTPVYDENGVETEESLKAKEKATMQKEYTYYPEVKMNNPFAKSASAKELVINYWVKLTEDAEKAGVSENTVVINIKKTAGLQYPSGTDLSTAWPTVPDSKVPYGFGNGFLQISADGSVIFTEDDGTATDQNKNSDTYGQNVLFNTDNNLVAEGSDKVLSDICKPGEWHMVTLKITNEGITTYYDAKKAEFEANPTLGSAFNDAAKGSLLIDWIAGADAVSIGGCNETVTKAFGFDANVTPFYLDDLRFYDSELSEAQITELYNEGIDKMTAKPIPEPTIIKFNSEDDFSTDIKSNNPKKDKVEAPILTKDARMGSVVKTFASKSTETSAAKLTTNPFAGKELTGATISYWMKADTKEVNEKTGEVTYSPSVGVSFVDGAKEMYHAKMQEVSKYTKASSILYGKTDGYAAFEEGTTDTKVPTTLKNGYVRSLATEDADMVMETNDGDWHFYTMVVTNKEIEYYVDGVKLDNEYLFKLPRFFDGYYQRTQDSKDNNEIYGGTGNTGATALLTFLTYADTEMYLAYANVSMSSSTYQTCGDAYFGEIACYDAALTDEQVAEVYNEQLVKYPAVKVVMGDANGDGNVNASDALVILKHAAKLATLEGDLAIAADVDSNGNIDSSDALKVLKKAANLIDSF